MQLPVEAAPQLLQFPAIPLDRNELPYRLRQQSLLGEFGRIAMQTREFRQILQRATELCAQGLQARFAKVLEYLPDENRLMVRAGVGWASDTIDTVSPPTLDRQQDMPTRQERRLSRTTWRRKPASGRLSFWRTTASGARSTCS